MTHLYFELDSLKLPNRTMLTSRLKCDATATILYHLHEILWLYYAEMRGG